MQGRRLRRLWLGIGIIVLGALCLTAGALGWAALEYQRAADYPGALQVADHNLYRLFPTPHLRRDTSYRSVADFPALYNWYSKRFRTGPEARAESACITLQSTEAVLLLERHTTVMLCDTGKDRLIFVTRALTLRWP